MQNRKELRDALLRFGDTSELVNNGTFKNFRFGWVALHRSVSHEALIARKFIRYSYVIHYLSGSVPKFTRDFINSILK